MQLATVRADSETCAARVEGDDVILLRAVDVQDVFSRLGTGDVAEAGRVLSRSAVDFVPPVTRPDKIFCVGLNYLTHVREIGLPVPRYPALFAKFASTLVGAEEPIELPGAGTEPMWEVELTIVIGRPLPRGSTTSTTALEAVGGYTVANDLTMRDWQRHTSQWLAGKAFDRSTPVGPVVVTPEEVGHASDLELVCEIDGEVRQIGSTSDLLFGPADLITYITTFAALEPGDLILTGTPAGSGPNRNDFLRPGQLMTSRITGIGECRNPIVASA